jgi:hypothetical protein
MAEQKQHVEMYKKILLRNALLKHQKVKNIYVPFIGDADIASESYGNYNIYGGDIDPKRVATARSNVKGNIKIGDCDHWIFPEIQDKFQAADFDSYCQPYLSFKAFWENANKDNALVLFFTDGHRQTIIRKGILVTPDGSKRSLENLNERRKLYNMYFATHILPWFTNYIKPYKIKKKQFYLRQHMLYWGAVIEK